MLESQKPLTPTHSDYALVGRHALQDNIVLFDTKCGILLGFAAAIFVWCLDKLLELLTSVRHGYLLIVARAEIVLFTFAILALLATIKLTWDVVKPRIKVTDDHIFWGSSVFKLSEADYINTIQNVDQSVLSNDILHHLHVLAEICRAKYANYKRAFVAVEFSAGFVFLAVLLQIISTFIRP